MESTHLYGINYPAATYCLINDADLQLSLACEPCCVAVETGMVAIASPFSAKMCIHILLMKEILHHHKSLGPLGAARFHPSTVLVYEPHREVHDCGTLNPKPQTPNPKP